MAAGDSSVGRIQLTWGVHAGALRPPVAAADPDTVALLEVKAQMLLEGHQEFIWMGCCQIQQGHRGPCLCSQRACSLRVQCIILPCDWAALNKLMLHQIENLPMGCSLFFGCIPFVVLPGK